MKLNVRHAAILAALLAVAIGFGFLFDGVVTAIEKSRYPRPEEFSHAIAESANTYGIPEAVLWAVIRTESNFASNKRSPDGSIGLMQLTPKKFDMIRTEIMGMEPLDAGMLYDPDTNLRCGAAYLSYLYQRYGIWETVFAAYAVGTSTVDKWLKSADCVDELGNLKVVPDESAEAYVKAASRALKIYTKLYYQ